MKPSITLSILSLAALSLAAPQFSFPTGGSFGSGSTGTTGSTSTTGSTGTTGTTGSTSLGSSSGSSTENDVVNNAACKTLTVIFARGTSESGNVGTVAGPPFFSALQSDVGASKVAIQGVDYAATWDGAFEGGDKNGSSTMAVLVGQAIQQCPSTKIVLSGYSQGAQLVHNAAKTLSATLTADISSVIVFGDPDNGQAVGSVSASKVDSFCASGDNVCDGTGITSSGDISSAHLTYGNDASAAASFVAKAAGLAVTASTSS